MTCFNAALASENILLISSNPGTRSLIRHSLFQRGYLVLEASNERIAAYISTLMGGNIDLIIADAAAPQLSTWADRSLPIPRILMLGSSADESHNTFGMAARVKQVITPLTEDGIAFEVRAVLDSPQGKRR
jgi:DNA-binding response OmpR family regulator